MYTSNSTKTFVVIGAVLACFMLLVVNACTSSTHVLSRSHGSLMILKKQQMETEEEFYQVLNRLEKYPNDRTLRLEKARLKKELGLLKVRVRTVQKQVDLDVQEWERRVDESHIQIMPEPLPLDK